jgi:hypothetical protein
LRFYRPQQSGLVHTNPCQLVGEIEGKAGLVGKLFALKIRPSLSPDDIPTGRPFFLEVTGSGAP